MKNIKLHQTGNDNTQQLLEYIFELQEEKNKIYTSDITSGPDINTSELEKLIEHAIGENLIKKSRKEIQLTPKGKQRAEHTVRARRLAERMFVDIFKITAENTSQVAHYMEHIIEPDILDAMCTFLGHPTLSPFGKPIPAGRCCRQKLTAVKPAFIRLTEMRSGVPAIIQYIQNPGKQLAHMGVLPGQQVRLLEKRPAVVIEVDQTTLALDSRMADDIYVKPVKSQEK